MNDTNIVRSDASNCGPVMGENFDLEASKALFQEVLTLMLNEDVATVHVLRSLIHTTIGFERLAAKMNKPAQSVKRMLSDTGNPTFNNLMANFVGNSKGAECSDCGDHCSSMAIGEIIR